MQLKKKIGMKNVQQMTKELKGSYIKMKEK